MANPLSNIHKKCSIYLCPEFIVPGPVKRQEDIKQYGRSFCRKHQMAYYLTDAQISWYNNAVKSDNSYRKFFFSSDDIVPGKKP